MPNLNLPALRSREEDARRLYERQRARFVQNGGDLLRRCAELAADDWRDAENELGAALEAERRATAAFALDLVQ